MSVMAILRQLLAIILDTSLLGWKNAPARLGTPARTAAELSFVRRAKIELDPLLTDRPVLSDRLPSACPTQSFRTVLVSSRMPGIQ